MTAGPLGEAPDVGKALAAVRGSRLDRFLPGNDLGTLERMVAEIVAIESPAGQ